MLEHIDEVLAERGAPLPPYVLGAKAIALAQLGETDEALAVVHRLLEDGDDPRDVLAFGRLRLVRVLEDRGEYSAALRALGDLESFYGDDEYAGLRAVGAAALRDRIGLLTTLGDIDKVRAAWESLRDAHGDATDLEIRSYVARGGKWAAVALSRSGRPADALATCDEVIALFRSDTDPAIRGDVAVSMWARLGALRRSKRRLSGWRATRELFHFIGSDPEPEIVEAMRVANPDYAEKILRASHDPH